MSKIVRIVYYGMEGEGPTLKEAKADAARKLQAFVKDTFQPAFFAGKTHLLAVIREQWGWTTRVILLAEASENGRIDTCASSGYADREDAIRHARSHLAQLEWRRDGSTDISPYIVDKADAADFAWWARWQRCYKAWADRGATEEEARNKANNSQFPEPPAEKKRRAA